MKIHFSATAPFDHIEMCGDAPCGAGKGVSQYGIDCTSNRALVDCKRCLNRIQKETSNEELLAPNDADAAPLPTRPVVLRMSAMGCGEHMAVFTSEADMKDHFDTEHRVEPLRMRKGSPNCVEHGLGFTTREASDQHFLDRHTVIGISGQHPGPSALTLAEVVVQLRAEIAMLKGDDRDSVRGPNEFELGRASGVEFALRKLGVQL